MPRQDQETDPPTQLPEPRTREQLKDWLAWREQQYPGVPLSAREYLMVQRLKSSRPPYSLT
jgi:hypothetical protein